MVELNGWDKKDITIGAAQAVNLAIQVLPKTAKKEDIIKKAIWFVEILDEVKEWAVTSEVAKRSARVRIEENKGEYAEGLFAADEAIQELMPDLPSDKLQVDIDED